MDIIISKYGTTFTSEKDTKSLISDILNILKENETIVIDFNEIQLMTTTAAKSILQIISDTYGYENIFKKVIFKNVTSDMKIIIATAVDGLEKKQK